MLSNDNVEELSESSECESDEEDYSDDDSVDENAYVDIEPNSLSTRNVFPEKY